ncbi:LysR family transcriptional regulator [Cupriavidus taiwanensis]|uniref:LysR family transcriptional regulator n=1 Tax=Cupriavidus taiwanensis TaxID=164546 RepID=UPI000E15E979|nr:LysR family transcriptional regulator [Cupriavidus taiwanensis]SPA18368.1 LysR family transcriptional regulator [Cupriavidus taiwanensis]
MERSALDRALLTDRLDWNLLRTFLTIVHERSLSRAAVRLHITQPAVSLALRRLEEHLGHTLIERRGSNFRLTRPGEEVLRIATDVYGSVARLGAELTGQQDEVSGLLRLLTVSRIHSGVYDECLAAFHRQHPRVTLQVDVMRSSEIVDALAQKAGGVGLSLYRQSGDKLQHLLFLRQRYAIFCGRHHRLFGRTGLGISDLLAEHFVSFSSDQLGDVLAPLAVFRDQHGFSGGIVATSASLDEIRRLVFAGYGIGCLPEHIVADDVTQQRLWRLPPEEGVADIDLYLLWNPERRQTPAEAAFITHFRHYVARYSLMERLGDTVNAPLAALRTPTAEAGKKNT